MNLLTNELAKQLRANAVTRPDNPMPVVKLFNPTGAGTWLLTELDEDDVAFGLCDVGHGFPELGYVSLEELRGYSRFGLGIERDLHFTPRKTLAEYATEAQELGRIKA